MLCLKKRPRINAVINKAKVMSVLSFTAQTEEN